jgi:outer membrane receptor protein involved in Fe transport
MTDSLYPLHAAWRRSLVALLAIGLFVFSPLTAQDEKEAAELEEDIITLRDFVIDTTQEYGYRATTSMTASRISTNIIDTPMNIVVMTGEFIDDLNYDNAQEAARYMSGVFADERVSTHGQGIVYVRSFRTPHHLNGVASFTASNFNAVDRVEVIKGPVGIFYGKGSPGGIYNIVTKKPEFINGGTFDYTYGSYEFHRFQVDLQGVVESSNNTIAYRIVSSYLNRKDWMEYENAEDSYLTASVRYNPNSKIDMVAEFEWANQNRNEGANAVVSNPQWHSDYETPRGEIIAHFKEAQDFATDQETIDFLRGRWRTSNARWTQDVKAVFGEENEPFRQIGHIDPFLYTPKGWSFNRNGPGAFDDNDGIRVFYRVTLKPTKWFDLNYQFSWTKSNRTDINNFFTTPNADYTLPVRENFNMIYRSLARNHQIDAKIRFSAAGMDHQILAGFEANWDKFGRFPHILNYDNVEPVLVPSQNDEGLEPSYWRGGNVSLGNNPVELTGRDVFQNFAPYLHPQPDYGDIIQGPAAGFKFNAPRRAEGVYVTHLGSAFKRGAGESGRLRTMYGVRWEKNPDNNDEGTTPSIGAVIEVFKGWHVYGSHSKTWKPNGFNITGGGVRPGEQMDMANETGVGTEIGVKTNWRDNTLSGTIGWFTVDRSNIRQQDQIKMDEEPRNNDTDLTNNVTHYALSGLERVKGIEADLVWEPIRNNQLLFTYSWFYFAKIVSDPSFRPGSFGFRIQNGRQKHDAPEHMLSVWNKYNFTEGPMKGLSLALGWRYVTGAESGNNKPFRFHRNPTYSLVDARIGYDTTLFNTRTSFSLQVENLFDKGWFSGLGRMDPRKAYFKMKVFF